MATQPRLLSPSFHLDNASREAGRRGLAKARAALADTVARTTAESRAADRAGSPDHATAA